MLGLLAGAIAKALLPGDDPGGIVATMIIGAVGALLGRFLAGLLFDVNPVDEVFSLSTWLAAIIGSIILLLIHRVVVGNKRGAGRSTVKADQLRRLGRHESGRRTLCGSRAGRGALP